MAAVATEDLHHQRVEGGGLARPGRAGQQKQAAVHGDDAAQRVDEGRTQPQLVQGLDRTLVAGHDAQRERAPDLPPDADRAHVDPDEEDPSPQGHFQVAVLRRVVDAMLVPGQGEQGIGDQPVVALFRHHHAFLAQGQEQAVPTHLDFYGFVVARHDVKVAGLAVDGERNPFDQDLFRFRGQGGVLGCLGVGGGLDRNQPGFAAVLAHGIRRQCQLRIADQVLAGERIGHEQAPLGPGRGTVRGILQGAMQALGIHRHRECLRQGQGDGLRVGTGTQQAGDDGFMRARAGQLHGIRRQGAGTDEDLPDGLETSHDPVGQGRHGIALVKGIRNRAPSGSRTSSESTSTA